MTTVEAKQAMETMKCPRCGGRLYCRDVINVDSDYNGLISREFTELYDIYGHNFPVHIEEFIKAREGK